MWIKTKNIFKTSAPIKIGAFLYANFPLDPKIHSKVLKNFRMYFGRLKTKEKKDTMGRSLPVRLMVGHRPLEASIGVRVPDRQL